MGDVLSADEIRKIRNLYPEYGPMARVCDSHEALRAAVTDFADGVVCEPTDQDRAAAGYVR